ncbi:DUF3471 domain-containing protein [Paenibacillus apiarius]|uniref:DUF3471 domain-containing protein n=1 Tax=Paenibacillus apiarius TaxID=46240 RepID=UPI00198255C2|nr:DUF3471 domain-containing protein [Paenibacillus apiarius]MBN3523396.1 DUF3471 domain-containing protein [Paenibacillus apiarius]
MDWNGRIEEDLKKWKEQLQEQKEKGRQNVKELKGEIESALPHPLIDYTGTYEHPGYGKASIELDNGRLQLMYNSLTLPMTHLNDDVFEISYERFEAEVKGTFYADSNGNILRFSVPMNIEPGAKEIEFTKN